MFNFCTVLKIAICKTEYPCLNRLLTQRRDYKVRHHSQIFQDKMFIRFLVPLCSFQHLRNLCDNWHCVPSAMQQRMVCRFSKLHHSIAQRFVVILMWLAFSLVLKWGNNNSMVTESPKSDHVMNIFRKGSVQIRHNGSSN